MPVLGVCFGAQALAAALGGSVEARRGPRSAGSTSTGEAPEAGRWFAWHEDVIDAAAGHAGSREHAGRPQAFAVGRSVGLQFHPEVTPAIVEDWLRTGRGDVDTHGVDADAVLRETRERAAEVRGRAFALLDGIAARWTA